MRPGVPASVLLILGAAFCLMQGAARAAECQDRDYTLLENGKYILEDEKEFTQILDQGGQPLGLQRHKLGRLHLRDGEAGQVLHSLSVPENGRVAAMGCQGSTAFCLSPGQLTLVDIKLRTVAASLPIPFDEAFLLLTGPQ